MSDSAVRTDVIHNIGYRHYAGTRLGRGYVRRSLFVQSLRSAYGLGRSMKSKILPAGILALMLLPAVVIVAVMNIAHLQKLPIPYTAYAIVMQTVVSIFVAAQAPQLVSRDLRFRTTTLYFSRPLTRFDYVVAKLGAMVSALFVLMAAPLLVLFAGALLSKLPVGDQAVGLLTGLAGVLLFSLVLSVLALLLASLTPRRGLGVAIIIALLLISSAGATVVQGLAAHLGAAAVGTYAGLFSPFTLVDGIQTGLLGAQPFGDSASPGLAGGVVFALVAVAVIAASFGLLLARYRKVVAA
ncbi:ABC transporter permease [Fodinicola acaciae]|uniref:ABC transporter permease n=1 Tax=Fodinicola acaciae TaxID=2681555 RepID=UPI0013D58D3A|nr:ABC transporter permease [Fodinicola acaciae]